MIKVKIVSSYTGFGGSTILFMNLCDLFNKNGIQCQFYGPHDWHINKSPHSRKIKDLKIENGDCFIGHMIDAVRFNSFFRSLPKCRIRVLSIHEKAGHLLVPNNLNVYDVIVFSSKSQKEWHHYYKGKQKLLVIPQVMSKLKKIEKKPDAVAGVIGHICLRKQTHVSILRALQAGCNKVLLYGYIFDKRYFNIVISPLLNEKVIYMGELHPDKKQEMYQSISCVYHSATDESACLVQGECQLVGLPFHGNDNVIPYEMWEDSRIIQAWKQVLGLSL